MSARHFRRSAAVMSGFIAALIVVFGMVTPAAAHSYQPNACERIDHKVTLAPTATTTYNIVGWLCGPRKASTVQILNSGFTYGSYYWNLPYQTKRYSYVRAASAAGFATLNLDRIGVGESDKPPADQVSVHSHAWVNAQLADALRKGQIGRHAPRFKYVIGVGHSLGGMIVTVAQADYKSFDAIVPNGVMHAADPAFLAVLATTRHDAAGDPKFTAASLPTGYITTKPDTRHNYYTPQFADPKVIALDEKLKQTATSGEVATLGLGRDSSYSKRVKVPSLVWLGDTDGLSCNESVAGLSCSSVQAILDRELPAWTATPCLGVYLQRQSGHDTTLHRTAPNGVYAVNRWLTELGFGPAKAKHLPPLRDYRRCA